MRHLIGVLKPEAMVPLEETPIELRGPIREVTLHSDPLDILDDLTLSRTSEGVESADRVMVEVHPAPLPSTTLQMNKELRVSRPLREDS